GGDGKPLTVIPGPMVLRNGVARVQADARLLAASWRLWRVLRWIRGMQGMKELFYVVAPGAWGEIEKALADAAGPPPPEGATELPWRAEADVELEPVRLGDGWRDVLLREGAGTKRFA